MEHIPFWFVGDYISNAVPIPCLYSAKTTSHPPSPLSLSCILPPIYPLLPHPSSIPLCWGIKPPQLQEPPLPLMPAKTIICCICSYSNGPIFVYSLVGNLLPGSSRGSYKFILLFFLCGCDPLQLLQFSP